MARRNRSTSGRRGVGRSEGTPVGTDVFVVSIVLMVGSREGRGVGGGVAVGRGVFVGTELG